jgi:hypothetical protein
MATKLDKDITRESTITVNERNIIVTLTKEQTIRLKLKGMKSGEQTISIQELYDSLSGAHVYKTPPPAALEIDNDQETKTKKRGTDDKGMISVHDLRSKVLISANLSLETKVKLEAIIVQLLSDK